MKHDVAKHRRDLFKSRMLCLHLYKVPGDLESWNDRTCKVNWKWKMAKSIMVMRMMLILVMVMVSTLVWERARERDQPKYFMAKEQTVEADLIDNILDTETIL